MQKIIQNTPEALSLEAVMDSVGPEMTWESFHQAADIHPEPKLNSKGFCYAPAYNSSQCVGESIAVQFVLPKNVVLTERESCVLSIVRRGFVTPDCDNYFEVNEYNF